MRRCTQLLLLLATQAALTSDQCRRRVLPPLTPHTPAMQRPKPMCRAQAWNQHLYSMPSLMAYQYLTDLHWEHCVVVGFWHTLHVLTSIDIRLATAALSHQGSPSRLLLLCSRKSGELSAAWVRTITTLQMHSTQQETDDCCVTYMQEFAAAEHCCGTCEVLDAGVLTIGGTAAAAGAPLSRLS